MRFVWGFEALALAALAFFIISSVTFIDTQHYHNRDYTLSMLWLIFVSIGIAVALLIFASVMSIWRGWKY